MGETKEYLAFQDIQSEKVTTSFRDNNSYQVVKIVETKDGSSTERDIYPNREAGVFSGTEARKIANLRRLNGTKGLRRVE